MKGLANFGRGRGWLQKLFRVDPAQRDLNHVRASFAAFSTLLQLFPHSRYAPDAQKRMYYIRNLLARHELETAKFYYEREVYVAAANRASGIVKHFEGAPQVVPALGIMVRSYRALGQTDMANEALQVLAMSYPNSKVYRQLRPR